MKSERENKKLDEVIEKKIRQWDGTIYGTSIQTMYDNGASYESICRYAGIDYEEFEDDEEWDM